jgi:hypothetical protein
LLVSTTIHGLSPRVNDEEQLNADFSGLSIQNQAGKQARAGQNRPPAKAKQTLKKTGNKWQYLELCIGLEENRTRIAASAPPVPDRAEAVSFGHLGQWRRPRYPNRAQFAALISLPLLAPGNVAAASASEQAKQSAISAIELGDGGGDADAVSTGHKRGRPPWGGLLGF